MTYKRYIIIIGILILVFIGVIHGINQSKINVLTLLLKKETATQPKDEINNLGSLNKQLKTFTSPSLGIQFNYVIDETAPSVQVFENEDRISFSNMGIQDTQNYIRVFKQLPNETVEQTLRRIIPDQFNSEYCVLMRNFYLADESYFIYDRRLPLNQRGTPNLGLGFDRATVCNPTMWLYFKTNIDFPGVIHYINYNTQSPSYWSDLEHTSQWTQTVHLIH